MSSALQRQDASRFAPAKRRQLAAPGLRAFLHIAGLWGLSEAERLRVMGLPPRSTYHGWVRVAEKGGELSLPVDTLTRISAVLGIHKALVILFATPAEQLGWLRGPHAALPFAGQPPMALVASGTQDGLMLVRRFLDAARGGLHMAPNAADESDSGTAAWAGPYTDDDIVLL